MTPTNSKATGDVTVSLLDDALLVDIGNDAPIRIDSALFLTLARKLLESNLQLTAEIRESRTIIPVRLLVLSVPTSRKVAIALPPAWEGTALAALMDHPDVAGCVVHDTWCPNLAEGIPPLPMRPRYARVRDLRP